MRGEGAEDFLLGVLALGGRLDGEVGGADGGEIRSGTDAIDGGGLVRFAEQALGRLARQARLDPREALGKAFGAHVVEQYVITGQGADLRDAAAHLARADDADRLDVHG